MTEWIRIEKLLDCDELLAETSDKGNNAVPQCQKCVVATYPNALTCFDTSSVLSNDDVTGFDELSPKFFDTETFAWSCAVLGCCST